MYAALASIADTARAVLLAKWSVMRTHCEPIDFRKERSPRSLGEAQLQLIRIEPKKGNIAIDGQMGLTSSFLHHH